MNHRCDELEETIWEHARTGREPPDGVCHHLDACASCRQMLEEATKLVSVLALADCAGEAPDCRATVMSRIAGRGRGFRLAWVYASVGVVVAVAVAGGIAARRAPVRSPSSSLVHAPRQLSPEASPTAGGNVGQDRPIVLVPRAPRSRTPSPQRHLGVRLARPMVARSDALPAPPAPDPQLLTPDPQPLAPLPRAVAAVAVTYPVAGETSSESYAYIEHNAETGETTKCSVNRSGDTVDIYLESTPGGDQPPVKGSTQNEKTNNA